MCVYERVVCIYAYVFISYTHTSCMSQVYTVCIDKYYYA